MIIIHIALTAASEAELQKLLAVAPKVIAATRKEKGCIEYAFARDVLDPRTLRVTERWASPAALEAHMNEPHTKEILAATRAANITAMSAKMFQGSGEQELQLPK
jgi:quinol monooxygenase YgiN